MPLPELGGETYAMILIQYTLVTGIQCALWAWPVEYDCSNSMASWCRYYAAPTMHQLIVAEALRGETAGDGCLRLIGNAAGPLLPSLASSLKSTFRFVSVLIPPSSPASLALGWECYAFLARSHVSLTSFRSHRPFWIQPASCFVLLRGVKCTHQICTLHI